MLWYLSSGFYKIFGKKQFLDLVKTPFPVVVEAVVL